MAISQPAVPVQRKPGASSLRLSETVSKATSILNALAREPYDLSATEVAVALGLDRTTTYRLLETLCRDRVIVRDPQTRRYRLGVRVLDYANAFRDRLEVRHIALSHLLDLQHDFDLQPELGQSTMIAVLDDLDVVLVEMSGAAALRGDLTRRMRFPAYISASGRSMLAYLPAEDLEARLERTYAGGGVTGHLDRPTLVADLAVIRARGYAVSDRQVGPDNQALAVAVRTRNGNALAAIGIVVRPPTGPVEDLVEQYAPRLMLIAERISVALRYRG
ncbi:MAG: IclR family transcriptional regulator [Chloroflexi bacterium]|nr:IclR family transcriptional regulator [Chloroflexota bacterium]